MQLRYLMTSIAGLSVTIDDDHSDLLRQALSASFGAEAFVRGIVWQKRTSPDMRVALGDAHDNVVVYSKDAPRFLATANRIPKTEKQRAAFANPDDDPRGPWVSSDFTAQGYRPNQMYEIVTPAGARYVPPDGTCWKTVRAEFDRLNSEGRIWFGKDGSAMPRRKTYLAESESNQSWSWWPNSEVGHNQEAKKELKALMGSGVADATPKPVRLISRLCLISADADDLVIDAFAGSGTTGHAVINLNREDDGNRKYILVEMGEYFDTVLKPRIAKVVYSADWKDGRPQSRDTGVSQVVKVIRLESYEDTLNNLQVAERGRYSELIDSGVAGEFSEGYMLDYMLDWEAGKAGLNVESFRKPFDYHLNVATDTVGESRPTRVDLVETFNYLIGIAVEHVSTVAGCRVVEGHDPAGDHVLVVWRDQEKTSNEDLDELFRKQRINVRDREFDLIYVNGDSNLENLKRPDDTWKVRLIEHEFMTRMFDVADV